MKETFDDRPTRPIPPTRPIKLELRARRKAIGAGPRRDIVGAQSNIKTPQQSSNFMPPTRSENELLDPKIEKIPTYLLQIWKFEIFEKNDKFSKHHYIREKKDNFWNQIFEN